MYLFYWQYLLDVLSNDVTVKFVFLSNINFWNVSPVGQSASYIHSNSNVLSYTPDNIWVISFARKLAPAFGTDLKAAYNSDTVQPSFLKSYSLQAC